jgi:hypothetical protein
VLNAYGVRGLAEKTVEQDGFDLPADRVLNA